MFYVRLVFCVTWLVLSCVRYNDACGRPTYSPQVRCGPQGCSYGVQAEWKFSKQNPKEGQCDALDEAIIKREEWRAMAPRHQQSINGVAKKVLVWQTRSDVCQLIGLTGYRCQHCLQDSTCLPSVIHALQDDDFRKGKDDIRYNFLIGQDGVIYEGRGWGIVGQHTDGEDDTSIGVAMIGDFNIAEPNQASQDALSKLMMCGEASGKLLSDVKLSASPKMAGQAFYSLLQRCNGLCV